MLCRLILHCLAAQLCRASPSESLSKSVYSLGKKSRALESILSGLLESSGGRGGRYSPTIRRR